jgi:hypothetical protein
MTLRWVGTVAACAALILVSPMSGQAADDVRQLKSAIETLQKQIAALQTEVAALKANGVLAVGPYVSVVPDPIDGVTGPHIIFNGANTSAMVQA